MCIHLDIIKDVFIASVLFNHIAQTFLFFRQLGSAHWLQGLSLIRTVDFD